MCDKESLKTRGFGFVTFYDEHVADQVMLDKDYHKIRNKWIDCKRAIPICEISQGSTDKSTIVECKDPMPEEKEEEETETASCDDKQKEVIEDKGERYYDSDGSSSDDGMTFRELRTQILLQQQRQVSSASMTLDPTEEGECRHLDVSLAAVVQNQTDHGD